MDDSLAEFEDRVYTVSEVTWRVSHLLENDSMLSDVSVEGEVSNFNHHSSGHMYFSLKDEDAVLGCVMFHRDNRSLDFEPEKGMRVVAEGRVGVYEERGEYQLYVDSLRKAGRGELYRQYLELKEELEGEGLFDSGVKQELPDFPQRVGVVTSSSGAALHDIRDVLGRRFPVTLVLSPAKVQGEMAAEEVSSAVERVDGECDVVIVGRGGGSIEDLWAFNEELVARSLYDCETPVVSAVGHEVDTTIADLVADERAATPSEAAELVVPHKEEVLQRLGKYERDMRDVLERRVDMRTQRLDALQAVLGRRPVIEDYLNQLDTFETSLMEGVRDTIEEKRRRVGECNGLLESLNPLNVLSRGYAVVKSRDEVVGSVDDVEIGDPLEVRLRDGRVDGRVEGKEHSE